MGFIYTDSVGMQESNNIGFDTEDEAYLNFYKDKLHELTRKYRKKQSELNKIQNDINSLDEKYSHLKDEFPEEFI